MGQFEGRGWRKGLEEGFGNRKRKLCVGIGVQIAPFCSPTLDQRHDFKKQCPRCIGDETCLMGNQNFPLNIVSGERLYINGGTIFNQNIFDPN